MQQQLACLNEKKQSLNSQIRLNSFKLEWQQLLDQQFSEKSSKFDQYYQTVIKDAIATNNSSQFAIEKYRPFKVNKWMKNDTDIIQEVAGNNKTSYSSVAASSSLGIKILPNAAGINLSIHQTINPREDDQQNYANSQQRCRVASREERFAKQRRATASASNAHSMLDGRTETLNQDGASRSTLTTYTKVINDYSKILMKSPDGRLMKKYRTFYSNKRTQSNERSRRQQNTQRQIASGERKMGDSLIAEPAIMDHSAITNSQGNNMIQSKGFEMISKGQPGEGICGVQAISLDEQAHKQLRQARDRLEGLDDHRKRPQSSAVYAKKRQQQQVSDQEDSSTVAFLKRKNTQNLTSISSSKGFHKSNQGTTNLTFFSSAGFIPKIENTGIDAINQYYRSINNDDEVEKIRFINEYQRLFGQISSLWKTHPLAIPRTEQRAVKLMLEHEIYKKCNYNQGILSRLNDYILYVQRFTQLDRKIRNIIEERDSQLFKLKVMSQCSSLSQFEGKGIPLLKQIRSLTITLILMIQRHSSFLASSKEFIFKEVQGCYLCWMNYIESLEFSQQSFILMKLQIFLKDFVFMEPKDFETVKADIQASQQQKNISFTVTEISQFERMMQGLSLGRDQPKVKKCSSYLAFHGCKKNLDRMAAENEEEKSQCISASSEDERKHEEYKQSQRQSSKLQRGFFRFEWALDQLPTFEQIRKAQLNQRMLGAFDTLKQLKEQEQLSTLAEIEKQASFRQGIQIFHHRGDSFSQPPNAADTFSAEKSGAKATEVKVSEKPETPYAQIEDENDKVSLNSNGSPIKSSIHEHESPSAEQNTSTVKVDIENHTFHTQSYSMAAEVDLPLMEYSEHYEHQASKDQNKNHHQGSSDATTQLKVLTSEDLKIKHQKYTGGRASNYTDKTVKTSLQMMSHSRIHEKDSIKEILKIYSQDVPTVLDKEAAGILQRYSTGTRPKSQEFKSKYATKVRRSAETGLQKTKTQNQRGLGDQRLVTEVMTSKGNKDSDIQKGAQVLSIDSNPIQ